MEKENWIEIKGYEGYYSISNKCRVKSHARIIHSEKRGTFNIKERILSSKITDVVLKKNGKSKTFDARSLMLIYFENYVPTREFTIIDSEKPKVITRRQMTSISKILSLENKSCKSTGVSKSRGLFLCQIEINSKSVFLGRHEIEKQAAFMYDFALKNKHLYQGNSSEFRIKLNSLLCGGENNY